MKFVKGFFSSILTIVLTFVIITFVFDIILIGGIRIAYRFILNIIKYSLYYSSESKHAMIIGSGSHAAMVIKEMALNKSKLNLIPTVVIDDSGRLVGKDIAGVRIEGSRKDITRIARKYRIDYIYCYA